MRSVIPGRHDTQNVENGHIPSELKFSTHRAQRRTTNSVHSVPEGYLCLDSVLGFIGLRVAPDLFTGLARSSWQEFMDDRAQYGSLAILRLSSLGLVQPASRFPVEGRPLTLGEAFAFSLQSEHEGKVFAFQVTAEKWHLFSLGEDAQDYLRPCRKGEQVLPSHKDGSPLPIIEAETGGLHSFVFIVCAADTDVEINQYAGLALRPEQLDGLSNVLLSGEGALLRVHRINVRITRCLLRWRTG